MEIWLLSKYFFLPALLTFFIFKIITWLINNQYSSSKKNLPPSPPKLPIIGNLHQLSFHFRSLKSLAKKYGPMVLIHLGSRTGVIISSAEAAEEILRKHDLSFVERPRISYAGRFGYGFRDLVFTPYGEYWRQARGICVSQLLSNKRVQSFRSVREEEIARTLETIKESCLSVCNMSEIFATLSFDVLCRSALGEKNSDEKDGRWFKALVAEASSLATLANVSDVIPWLGWINHINGREARAKRIFKEVDGYLENYIEKTIKRSQECDDHQDDHNSFVDVLLQYERLDSDSTGFTLDRASVKALILTYDVAPNTIIFIDAGLIGRDPKNWEEPNEFRPERFLVKNPVDIKGQHFHYLPFGSGRRICPGSGAAMAIVELAIANLIRDFNFTLPDGAKPEDLDMTETFSVTSTRKVPLLLVSSYS